MTPVEVFAWIGSYAVLKLGAELAGCSDPPHKFAEFMAAALFLAIVWAVSFLAASLIP